MTMKAMGPLRLSFRILCSTTFTRDMAISVTEWLADWTTRLAIMGSIPYFRIKDLSTGKDETDHI